MLNVSLPTVDICGLFILTLGLYSVLILVIILLTLLVLCWSLLGKSVLITLIVMINKFQYNIALTC